MPQCDIDAKYKEWGSIFILRMTETFSIRNILCKFCNDNFVEGEYFLDFDFIGIAKVCFKHEEDLNLFKLIAPKEFCG